MTKKLKRFFVLETMPVGGEYSGFEGETVGVVEMTRELAQLILRRAEALQAVKASDTDAWEIYFWDGCVTYFGDHSDIPEGMVEQGDEYTLLAKHPLTDEQQNTLRANTEIDQMVIRPDEVAWTCMPKHSEVYAVTGSIPLDVVKEYV